MKMFLLLVLSVTALFVWQRQSKDMPTAATLKGKTPIVTSPASSPVSKHNWAKHSLDRVQQVGEQVQKSREENDQP